VRLSNQAPLPADWRCAAYGLEVGCAEWLPGFEPAARDRAQADLVVEMASTDAVDAAWSGGGTTIWETRLSGARPFRCERGGGGDLRFDYAGSAGFHVDAEARRLLAAPGPAAPADWQQVLLDSVLFCIRLALGHEALHGSAVRTGAGATAIVAATGSGKTSLAAELVRRGRPLLSDDILVLENGPDRLLVHPGPPLMNLPTASTERLADHVETLARFEGADESWVEVGHAVREPLALEHVVLLSRLEGSETSMTRLAPNPLALLPHAVFIDDDPERRLARFELFSSVASKAALWDLRGGARATPSDLADLVEENVL
jgi:hypothetical protein